MAVAGGDNSVVALAAALLSCETGEGYACLPLPRLSLSEDAYSLLGAWFVGTGEPEGWAECLLTSSAINHGEQPTPLVLYGERLYLNRMWRSERAAVRSFDEVSHVIEVDEQRLAHMLVASFPPLEGINWQKVAAAVALTRRISVTSDGSRMGKTTTVARLLAALIQMADGGRYRIRLAAPAGKAAARLTSSLGAALRKLLLADEQKKRIPDGASMLYQLLDTQPGSRRLRHHTGDLLHLDVLMVDEALTIGLPMMSRLIDVLSPRGRMILLGDRDQLASVEVGAVLGDICASVGDGFTPGRARQLSCLTGSAIPTGTGT